MRFAFHAVAAGSTVRQVLFRPASDIGHAFVQAGLVLVVLVLSATSCGAVVADEVAPSLRLKTFVPRAAVPERRFPIRLAQSGPSFLELLFGGGSAPPVRRTRPRPRFASPGYVPYGYRNPDAHRQRGYSLFGGIFDSQRSPYPRSYPGRYRTVCVRTCDGYYFPISASTSRSQFYRDAEKCQSRCGQEATLFYQPFGQPGAKSLVDLDGNRYEKMSYAFKYRKAVDPACRCTPQPWSAMEKARHAEYAEAETDAQYKARKALEAASIKPYLTPEQIARNEERKRKEVAERQLAFFVLQYGSGLDPLMKLAAASRFDLSKINVITPGEQVVAEQKKPARVHRRFPRRWVSQYQRRYQMQPLRWYRLRQRLPTRRYPVRRLPQGFSGRVYRVYR